MNKTVVASKPNVCMKCNTGKVAARVDNLESQAVLWLCKPCALQRIGEGSEDPNAIDTKTEDRVMTTEARRRSNSDPSPVLQRRVDLVAENNSRRGSNSPMVKRNALSKRLGPLTIPSAQRIEDRLRSKKKGLAQFLAKQKSKKEKHRSCVTVSSPNSNGDSILVKNDNGRFLLRDMLGDVDKDSKTAMLERLSQMIDDEEATGVQKDAKEVEKELFVTKSSLRVRSMDLDDVPLESAGQRKATVLALPLESQGSSSPAPARRQRSASQTQDEEKLRKLLSTVLSRLHDCRSVLQRIQQQLADVHSRDDLAKLVDQLQVIVQVRRLLNEVQIDDKHLRTYHESENIAEIEDNSVCDSVRRLEKTLLDIGAKLNTLQDGLLDAKKGAESDVRVLLTDADFMKMCQSVTNVTKTLRSVK